MATSVFQNLEDMVTCAICLEPFEGRDPRSLPCLHSFCSVCLNGLLHEKKLQKSEYYITCPVCQSGARIPAGNVSKLPAFFPSIKIQDVLKQEKTKYSICKVCETASHKFEVTSYCFQCTYAMCSTCKSKHDLRHENHVLITVSGSNVMCVVCPEHDKHVDAFCVECSRVVCSICSNGTHSDHQTKDFSENGQMTDGDLEQILSLIFDTADSSRANLTNILTEVAQVTTNRDEHNSKPVSGIPTVEPVAYTMHNIQQDQGRISLLAGYLRLKWTVKSEGTCDISFLPGGYIITVRHSGLAVYNHENGKRLDHMLTFLCTKNIQAIAVDIDRSTVAAIQYKRRDPDPLHIYTALKGHWKHKKYVGCVKSLSVTSTFDGHFIISTYTNTMYKYTTHGKKVWKTKLTFSPEYITADHNNRVLVADTAGGRVVVHSQHGVEMFSFPQSTDQRKIKPRGLCVDSDDHILVADERSKSILLFDVGGRFLQEILNMDETPYDIALYKDQYLALRHQERCNKLLMYELWSTD